VASTSQVNARDLPMAPSPGNAAATVITEGMFVMMIGAAAWAGRRAEVHT